MLFLFLEFRLRRWRWHAQSRWIHSSRNLWKTVGSVTGTTTATTSTSYGISTGKKCTKPLHRGRREKNRHDRSDDCPNRDVYKAYRKSMPNPTTNPHHESRLERQKFSEEKKRSRQFRGHPNFDWGLQYRILTEGNIY